MHAGTTAPDSEDENRIPSPVAMRRPPAALIDLSIIVVAVTGLWLFWSYYSYISTLSWWHERTERLRRATSLEKPDYELTNLPWQVVKPSMFELKQGVLAVVTGTEPFTYQAYATVTTNGASTVDFHFESYVESGDVTIGLIQAGNWIASSSSMGPGAFADSNAARLGRNRTFSVVIANNNPAGESRLLVKSLRVFLRR